MPIYSIGGRKELVFHPVWHFTWCTLHRSRMCRMTICSFDVDLSWFGARPCSMSVSGCGLLTCIQISWEAGHGTDESFPSGKQKMRKSRFAFHAKMGTIKDRNGMDLTEAEDIKKRWQEYTEELYKKKILMTQVTTMVWSLTCSQTSWNAKSSGP